MFPSVNCISHTCPRVLAGSVPSRTPSTCKVAIRVCNRGGRQAQCLATPQGHCRGGHLSPRVVCLPSQLLLPPLSPCLSLVPPREESFAFELLSVLANTFPERGRLGSAYHSRVLIPSRVPRKGQRLKTRMQRVREIIVLGTCERACRRPRGSECFQSPQNCCKC